ncbi:MAG: FKBP-type peptidyl-prolyl cis-trans isomerase [Prevotellaceae bacterium]|jgi:FKBP-type peptidyl-prolyl cis-trans isomerase|nr:FKBP-type peptidyl-prolyl cis-trans isomerase [Prevotellaceae bacterium]
MKRIVIFSLLALCTTFAFAKKPKQPVVVEPSKPATLTEIISYALGANIGSGMAENVARFNIELNWEFVKQGLSEAAAGQNQFDQTKMQEALSKLDSLARAHQKIQSEKALAEQKAFFEKNKTVEGVITTESGLQYKVITLSEGAKPTASDKVKVHYHGTLLDGTVFDSSIQRGEPITFPLNQVIKGWTESVQLMPVGSKFIFYIPSELAYGEQGAGGAVPPNAALIFEVELLEINPTEE